MVRQSNVFYSLERKTAGVTAHYDPVQNMASFVRWHVHELNQVVVVQQSLQLVNIATGRVFKMKVKITNKREISACVTVSETSVGNSSKNILFDSLFCLLGGGRYKQITETDVLSFDNRSSTDSNELNGRGCMEMESDSADLNMIAMPPPLRPMRGNEWKR